MTSFDPIYDERSEILLLGTFPSVKSREAGFYYAHPQNAFWRIMGELICGDRDVLIGASDARKKQVLRDNNIALWDVCETCEVSKSSDASIRNVKYNDIAELIGKTQIKTIFFNGGKAEELFERYRKEKNVKIDLPCRRLPSTSPARAIPYEDKLRIWKEAIELYL